mmetsp:Transcript_86124/g.241033  ORF Transcript_86124/g.241033 Transcript_86124/m.241033 type:complete len:379 (+) Transcript_86124:541-1677(+)
MAEEGLHRLVRQHSLLRGPWRDKDVWRHLEVLRRMLHRPQDIQLERGECRDEELQAMLVNDELTAEGHIEDVVALLLVPVEPLDDLRVLRALRHGRAPHRGVVVHADHHGVGGAAGGVAAGELRQGGDDHRVRVDGLEHVGLEAEAQPPTAVVVRQEADEARAEAEPTRPGVHHGEVGARGDLFAGKHGAHGGLGGPRRLHGRHPDLGAEGDAHDGNSCGLAQRVCGPEDIATEHDVRPQPLDLGEGGLVQRPTQHGLEDERDHQTREERHHLVGHAPDYAGLLLVHLDPLRRPEADVARLRRDRLDLVNPIVVCEDGDAVPPVRATVDQWHHHDARAAGRDDDGHVQRRRQARQLRARQHGQHARGRRAAARNSHRG